MKPTSKIEEGREHKDKDSFDTNGKVGDTYKTTKGTVTKTTNGVRHERSAGKEEKDSDYIDAMDRTDEGIMSSIKSALGGKKKPVARTRSTPKPDELSTQPGHLSVLTDRKVREVTSALHGPLKWELREGRIEIETPPPGKFVVDTILLR